ncbi:MAG: CpaF family protein [Candidatus Omnitrophota bacterium]|jgi:pilus assembly protein CpaF|nr:MAG: CpaF family protein [Candidatus Omnitrophota bacterium]
MIRLLKEKIRKKLISEYRRLFVDESIEDNELKGLIRGMTEDIISRENPPVSQEDTQRIVSEIINEFMGFGPIEGILHDASITEIMINGPKKIYIERNGRTELSNIVFDDGQQVMHLVDKILLPTRRHVDEASPYTDVSLKDGSRVNIIIPPLALDGPVITIRKFLKDIKEVEDLHKLGTCDKRISDFLIACIKARVNIVFAGATGAGKTTTLNVLSSYISNDERIVTIEDTAELRLNQDHVVRLEAKQANIEGKGEITIRELFKNSLRMRPDRIILGEIRGVEALDMLQAICSGHTGSLAVIHADSPQDVIYRLETMILTSGVQVSLEAIHRQVAAALNIIVQQEQLVDGTRKVTHVSQVNGLNDGKVVVEDLFLYAIEHIDPHSSAVKGKWEYTGIKPAFLHKFKKANIALPEDIFR